MLFGGLLVAALITGLLAMHTLNLHGTAAAHAPAVSVSVANADVVHHGDARHSAADTHLAGSAGHDPAASCTDCGSDGDLGTAMACVLALLLALLILVPPRMLPGWLRMRPRPVVGTRSIGGVLSRAPSLHVLCISRT